MADSASCCLACNVRYRVYVVSRWLQRPVHLSSSQLPGALVCRARVRAHEPELSCTSVCQAHLAPVESFCSTAHGNQSESSARAHSDSPSEKPVPECEIILTLKVLCIMCQYYA